MFVGIDLGASAIHAVALEDSLELFGATVLPPENIADLINLVHGAKCIAIDAPSALSTAPHLDDMTLSVKFRSGRCAEIALGREHGLWVPWVTPSAAADAAAWMTLGLRLYEELASAGHRLIEVYSHAGFFALAGRKLPKKSTPAGILARAGLLQEAGINPIGLTASSHDALDAAVAALTAHRAHFGTARQVTCGHAGSAIWLP